MAWSFNTPGMYRGQALRVRTGEHGVERILRRRRVKRIADRILAALLALRLARRARPRLLGIWPRDRGARSPIATSRRRRAPRSTGCCARRRCCETAGCPAKTIEQASVWADCIKTLGPRFSYAYNWHYQNVNICKPFDLKGACKDGNCVSAQIERDVKMLKDADVPRARARSRRWPSSSISSATCTSRSTPATAATWAATACAQPMASTRPSGSTCIRSGTAGSPNARSRPRRRWSASIRPRSAARSAAGSVEDWSRESWQVAHDVAYASRVRRRPLRRRAAGAATLDDATIDKLVVAGARAAGASAAGCGSRGCSTRRSAELPPIGRPLANLPAPAPAAVGLASSQTNRCTGASRASHAVERCSAIRQSRLRAATKSRSPPSPATSPAPRPSRRPWGKPIAGRGRDTSRGVRAHACIGSAPRRCPMSSTCDRQRRAISAGVLRSRPWSTSIMLSSSPILRRAARAWRVPDPPASPRACPAPRAAGIRPAALTLRRSLAAARSIAA